jgi:hypothetical protein
VLFTGVLQVFYTGVVRVLTFEYARPFSSRLQVKGFRRPEQHADGRMQEVAAANQA